MRGHQKGNGECEERAAPAGVVVNRWTLTLAAAGAFRAREVHLTVPRRHLEIVRAGGVDHEVKLGVALANARQRRGPTRKTGSTHSPLWACDGRSGAVA